MERKIDRHFKLKPDEVRRAVMAWLKEQDIPMPLDYDDVKFDLDESGAIVAWTEYAIVEPV